MRVFLSSVVRSTPTSRASGLASLRRGHMYTIARSAFNQAALALLRAWGAPMLGVARLRRRWRSSILCVHPFDTCRHAVSGATSAAKREELANGEEQQSDVVEGFRREGARLHYEAVRSDVEKQTVGNTWIKPEHGGHIADFLAHIVAASFASLELYDKTPAGLYDFLPCVFPHPNMNCRQRTHTAKRVALTLGPQLEH